LIQLIHGSDDFTSFNKAKTLIKKLQKELGEDTDIVKLEADSISIEDIFLHLQSQGLFEDKKVLLIKNFTQNSQYKEAVDDILQTVQNPRPNLHIIFWERGKVPGNTKFGRYFKNAKLETVCNELRKNQIEKYARETLAKKSIKIDPDALQTLLLRTNFDIGFLSNEIKKLSLLNKPEVTTKLIKDLVPDSEESLIWDLTDAITESDRKKAILAVNNLLKYDSENFTLIPMIGRQLRIMIQIKQLLSEGKNHSDMAKELRQAPFIISKVAKYSGDITMDKLKRLFQKLIDLDTAIKVGEIEPKIALTLFCTLI
jgi:DNA polymerase-3 subunit delta